MRRLPRSLVAPVAIVVISLSGSAAIGATTARGDLRPREAAGVLDDLPLPAGSEASGRGDRSRTFVVPATASSVVEFYRTELTLVGWTERSASQTSDLEDDAAEDGDDDSDIGADRDRNTDAGGSGLDDEGVDGGSEPSRVGPTRVVFVEPDVRLRVVVRDVNEADSTPDANVAASELRLVVKAR